MPSLADTVEGKRVENHRPGPRLIVTPDAWHRAASELAAGRATLLAGGATPIRRRSSMALADAAAGEILVVSLRCPDKKFPSVGALHPPAIRLERAIHSLYGYEPTRAPDPRPWLDLGFWGVQPPLGTRSTSPQAPSSYDFLPLEGEALLNALLKRWMRPAPARRGCAESCRRTIRRSCRLRRMRRATASLRRSSSWPPDLP
jgi:hypothetical protein